MIDLFTLIGFGAVGQAFLLSTKYATEKWGIRQSLLLSLFLVLGLFLLHDVLAHSRLLLQWPFLFGLGPVFSFLIGPILYFYISSILKEDFRFRWFDIFHLTPFLVAIINRWDTLSLSLNEKHKRLSQTYERIDRAGLLSKNLDWDAFIHFLWWHLLPIAYFILIIWMLRKRGDFLFGLKKLSVWIQFLCWGLVGYYMFDYAREFFIPAKWNHEFQQIALLLLSTYIFLLSYILLKYPHNNFAIKPIPKDAYSRKEYDQLFSQLEALMEEKELYLKADLKIAEVARYLGEDARELSICIKNVSKQNFTDYLNSLRVNRAQQLLANPEFMQYTIAAIGEQSGFRSKDVFYRAFQKITGLTPGAFRQKRVKN